ncbi:hypothetical protein [Pararobbsia alpina]|uniref:Uncharacterized protein n=1 Tax=Pararobbsia alpina TaxID=621374 RepID=A0A6S7BYH9_9BURK|nr:hypothetical protein [Pararobbsia alpina]CAB3808446.1 hypothetical protein LMG28138_06045 [Pararobbsia alpina]
MSISSIYEWGQQARGRASIRRVVPNRLPHSLVPPLAHDIGIDHLFDARHCVCHPYPGRTSCVDAMVQM